jgi:hypothetical protein
VFVTSDFSDNQRVLGGVIQECQDEAFVCWRSQAFALLLKWGRVMWRVATSIAALLTRLLRIEGGDIKYPPLMIFYHPFAQSKSKGCGVKRSKLGWGLGVAYLEDATAI